MEIREPQFHRAAPRGFRRGTYSVGPGRGDLAMWIIMYIAVMASLQAMGLEPGLVPIRTDDDDRPPCGDI